MLLNFFYDVTVTDKCGRVIVFDGSWRTVKGDPRMSEILVAATSSTPYKEAVQAKLDGLTAEEVKKLPHHHGAKEFYKWWNSMEVLEEAILAGDGWASDPGPTDCKEEHPAAVAHPPS